MLHGEVRESKQDNLAHPGACVVCPRESSEWQLLSSSLHSNNINDMPNFVDFIPFMSGCMFNGHEQYLVVNRGANWPEIRSWAGPGVPTPKCKPMGVC